MAASAARNRERARLGNGVRPRHPECGLCEYHIEGRRGGEMCLVGWSDDRHSHNQYAVRGRTFRRCADARAAIEPDTD
jgi:hypothetical protein